MNGKTNSFLGINSISRITLARKPSFVGVPNEPRDDPFSSPAFQTRRGIRRALHQRVADSIIYGQGLLHKLCPKFIQGRRLNSRFEIRDWDLSESFEIIPDTERPSAPLSPPAPIDHARRRHTSRDIFCLETRINLCAAQTEWEVDQYLGFVFCLAKQKIFARSASVPKPVTFSSNIISGSVRMRENPRGRDNAHT